MISLKPQKSSKGLTGYFLMRWFITKVSIIIRYPYQRACENGSHFIITCRMGCQKQNVQEISDIILTHNYQLEKMFVPGTRRKKLR
jgi:hypothetical protein